MTRFFTLLLFALTLCVALPQIHAQTITSDDFNAFNLKTTIWTFTDPVGDATLTLVGTNTTNAQLSLSIPAGTSHDPFEGENRVPRIMQPASNSDFVIQTKFESSMNAQYQIQGVIVEASPTEFLRFDFYSDGSSTFVYSALGNGGSQIINQNIGLAGIQPLYLRVARVGNDWTLSHSQNGTTWTDETPFPYMMTVTKVGVYAGSAVGGGGAPAHTVLVDYFQNNATPIASEDGNSSVVDTFKPLTYNIQTVSTSSSIQVNWKTDEAANGRVEYGTTASYELGFQTHASFITSHSLQINGLAATTLYHYRVISGDNGGRKDTTTDRTASTTGSFTMTDVLASPTSVSATFTWTTSEPTTSRVVYGTTVAYGDTLLDTTRTTTHLLNVTNLTTQTTYHFRLTSVDSLGNSLSTSDMTFTTTASSNLVADEFNTGTLNPVWQLVNPAGNGTQSMAATHVRLAVPAGTPHDMWTDNKDAIRIKQNCNNADFQMTVKYDSGMSQGFQIQGLIVQQDSVNLIRFDFNSDGVATYLLAATFTNNTAAVQLNQGIDQISVAPLYMRVTRRGAEWTQEHSLNGTSWTTGITFYHRLTVSSIALFAGNAVNYPAFGTAFDYFRLTAGPTGVTANLKAFLEGPYSVVGDTMRTDIRSSMPLSQPYNVAPWNYAGSEVVGAIPQNVVDWVLIELRTDTLASSKVATRAGFIKQNGTIVDTSGTGAVTFDNVNTGNYRVVIYHRNHLSVMSATLLALSPTSTLYNFASSSTQAHGSEPMKQLETGVWGLYGGDGNKSAIVTAADANLVFGAINQPGYNINDSNLSGIVTAADANTVFGNLNKASRVP